MVRAPRGAYRATAAIRIGSSALSGTGSQTPCHRNMVATQMARLGNTPYEIGSCEVRIDGEPMIPLSVLGELRKQLVEKVDAIRLENPNRHISREGVAAKMLASARMSSTFVATMESTDEPSPTNHGELRVLCRSLEQLKYGLESGHRKFYVEFHDIREYRQAVSMARDVAAEIYLATLRIQKQGEVSLFKALAKHGADGWLVRNLAALRFATEHAIPRIADFSLNVTNPLTAEWLASRGASRVTPSYDLNRDQLVELVGQMPPEYLEVVV
ncbi:MAG: U32 family peptidase, partial [Planctomycetes bacterium]|nr:U32 family peptidase [Planctomycetota bacterium]